MLSRRVVARCCAWLLADCARDSGSDKRRSGHTGTAAERARKPRKLRNVLGVGWREALDLPDGAVENTLETRTKIAWVVRLLRPRVVILPYWQARHPDHAMVATLGYEACFLAGLAKAPSVRQTLANRSQEVPAVRPPALSAQEEAVPELSWPSAAPAVQDRLRESLRGCAAEFHCGHHAVH